ncbi:MAG: acyl carrier protein [Clostridia bacterium]|nr:acyl carrier protein [Clostridia bacterium]
MDDREKLLSALKEVRDDVDFEGQYGLVDEGVIDSLDLTQIIAALDEAFDIHIPAGEIEPENFNSVDDMLAMVRRYQQQ